jgi:hypothetical protein
MGIGQGVSMEAEVIEWVDERCQQWATQYRVREYGGGHQPLTDLKGLAYQHSPEGLTPPAQEFSAAVFRMRATRNMEDPHLALLAYALCAGSHKAKARAAGMDVSLYWRNLNYAQSFIAARIEQPMREAG